MGRTPWQSRMELVEILRLPRPYAEELAMTERSRDRALALSSSDRPEGMSLQILRSAQSNMNSKIRHHDSASLKYPSIAATRPITVCS